MNGSLFDLHESVLTDYENFVRSFFTITDERAREFVERTLFDEAELWPEPLLQLSPSYARAASVDELAAAGTITSEAAALFRTTNGSPFYLYQHQVEALEKALKAESYVVTSGTGSGKSLTYFLPIIDNLIVQQAIANGIRVIPIPGVSSLMPALIASGFPIDSFVFHGFLSPKREERIAELKQLRKEPRTTVIMETPYRLAQVLKDLASVFGESRNLCIAFDVTLPTEEFLRGTPTDLLRRLEKQKRKGEFVIVLGPARR
ncbi:MAG: DEAD/DEAH box helicase [Ignavibacteria bacterium]|nr:DEAD/DEAH box helicase [Ignavibacteria bacterium]